MIRCANDRRARVFPDSIFHIRSVMMRPNTLSTMHREYLVGLTLVVSTTLCIGCGRGASASGNQCVESERNATKLSERRPGNQPLQLGGRKLLPQHL
jgi:hypothetical protein